MVAAAAAISTEHFLLSSFNINSVQMSTMMTLLHYFKLRNARMSAARDPI
jgi:hypothetical protein